MKKKNAQKVFSEQPVTTEDVVVEDAAPVVEAKKNRYDYYDIDSAPRNGSLIFLSETGVDAGELSFWKRTRAFANATHKWEETGFFVNNLTNLPISFKPKFWRYRGMYEI